MLGLLKQITMKNLSIIKKHKKKLRWVNWVVNKLKKKGILVDTTICAYGENHIVKKVITCGGGYVFWSAACSGCPIGQTLIQDYKKDKILPAWLPCILLKNALISDTPVGEGDIVRLLPLEPNQR